MIEGPLPVSSPLVLLVDDDRDTRDMYSTYLGANGFRVEQARDAQQALASLPSLRPDVLVTDLALPGLDGFSLSRQARDAAVGPLHIVAVTGYSLEHIGERAREAGIDCVLLKPCLPDRLVEAICGLLGQAGGA